MRIWLGAAVGVSLFLFSGVVRGAVPAIGDVFVIAMENHNWTEAGAPGDQLLGNGAAPFIQSLVTPGNGNAVHTAYETAYYQAGNGEHPSEPNYVWAEAGTNFNRFSTAGNSGVTSTTQGLISGTTILDDSDPGEASGNVFPASAAGLHLTGQLNAAGIAWKNYQEDVEYSASPLVSASGTGGAANVYNGSLQFDYAVKHNPMAFFADTATQNVAQLSQLQSDLTGNTVGRYNWITPNENNDMHTELSGGFTDPRTGIHYSGDEAQVAQGDNFLSIVVPEIMASAAFQNNGVIVLWNDETEGGDDATVSIMEIVISNLAKGNGYASSVVTNHSSDLKTWEEVFGLPVLDNPIPSGETFAGGGYATVEGSNDLSDLFIAGAAPEPGTVGVLAGGAVVLIRRRITGSHRGHREHRGGNWGI